MLRDVIAKVIALGLWFNLLHRSDLRSLNRADALTKRQSLNYRHSLLLVRRPFRWRQGMVLQSNSHLAWVVYRLSLVWLLQLTLLSRQTEVILVCPSLLVDFCSKIRRCKLTRLANLLGSISGLQRSLACIKNDFSNWLPFASMYFGNFVCCTVAHFKTVRIPCVVFTGNIAFVGSHVFIFVLFVKMLVIPGLKSKKRKTYNLVWVCTWKNDLLLNWLVLL